MEILLIRTSTGFIPESEAEWDKVKKIKLGALVRSEIAQIRNAKFFRKWWSLVSLAFDHWSEELPKVMHRGQPVQPEMERFRKDLIILTGRYHVVVNYKGETRLEADSISFAKMDEETFEKLYSETINVILKKIIPNSSYTDESIRAVVDQILGYS